jgi:Zn/Cd-binding protein ZinT
MIAVQFEVLFAHYKNGFETDIDRIVVEGDLIALYRGGVPSVNEGDDDD